MYTRGFFMRGIVGGMWRMLFTIVAAASLLLCLAVAALWWRSLTVQDVWGVSRVDWIYPMPAAATRPGVIVFPMQWFEYRDWDVISVGGRLFVRKLVAQDWSPDARRWHFSPLRSRPERPPWFFGRRWFFFRAELQDEGPLGQRWCPTILVPDWAIAAAFASVPIMWGVRRVRRRPPHACRRCGYDLRATPGRCPECGVVPAGVSPV